MSKQKLARLSRDPKTRDEYKAREKSLKDKVSAFAKYRAEGKAEGIEEGRAEGREEGKAEGKVEGKAEGIKENKITNAKNLLQLLDDDIIAQTIGLEVEEVQRLRAEME